MTSSGFGAPDWVAFASFPRKESITMNSQCGVFVPPKRPRPNPSTSLVGGIALQVKMLGRSLPWHPRQNPPYSLDDANRTFRTE